VSYFEIDSPRQTRAVYGRPQRTVAGDATVNVRVFPEISIAAAVGVIGRRFGVCGSRSAINTARAFRASGCDHPAGNRAHLR